MQAGLPLDSPLGNKLWHVSQLLQKSPFDPILLSHNEAQLDFILLMYTRDNPKGKLRVTRPGVEEQPVIETRWADVLTGRSYDEFMVEHMPPDAVMRALRGERPLPAPTPPGPPTGTLRKDPDRR